MSKNLGQIVTDWPPEPLPAYAFDCLRMAIEGTIAAYYQTVRGHVVGRSRAQTDLAALAQSTTEGGTPPKAALPDNAMLHETSPEALDRAVELRSEDVLLRRARALVRIDSHWRFAAGADVDRALELEPEHAPTWALRSYLNELDRDYAAACTRLCRAVELGLSEPAILAHLGYLCLRMGSPGDGLVHLDAAIAAGLSEGSVFLIRAWCHLRLGDMRPALDDLHAAEQTGRRDQSHDILRAHILFQIGDESGAVEALGRLSGDDWLRCEPDYAAWRASLYYALGEPQLALPDLELALAADPANALRLYQRGLVNESLGELTQALHDHCSAAVLDPESHLSCLRLGALLRETGNADQSLAALDLATQRAPLDPAVYFERGLTLLRVADCPRAIDDFTKALSLDPTDAAAHYHRGLACRHEGRLGEALADLGRALELDPSHPSARLELRGLEEQLERAGRDAGQENADAGECQGDTTPEEGTGAASHRTRLSICPDTTPALPRREPRYSDATWGAICRPSDAGIPADDVRVRPEVPFALFGDEMTGGPGSAAKAGGRCIEPRTNENSPVHEAVKAADLDLLQSLLEAGDPPDEFNHHGYTPLLQAVRAGSTGIVRLLLQRKADPGKSGIYGWTALHWAARLGHTEVARLLIAARAEVAIHSEVSATPLHQAAGQGHCDVARLLLAADANLVNTWDSYDETPLHWAVRGGHAQMVDLLIQHQAAVNTGNRWGVTPLHLAIRLGDEWIVRVLLAAGAHPLLPNVYGTTPLALASAPEAVKARRVIEQAVGAGARTASAVVQAALRSGARGRQGPYAHGPRRWFV